LTAERKNDVDRGLCFYRQVVEQIRAVTPGLDCVDRRLAKHGWAAGDLQIFYVAGGGDSSGEDNSASGARGASDGRIGGICPGDQESFGDSA